MTKQIPLTQGQFAIVDDEDFEKFGHLKWCATKHRGKYYVSRKRVVNGFHTSEKLHRVIMNAKGGEFVDHINRNPLDNQRLNLRICTNSSNMMNRGATKTNKSGYKGVHWVGRIKKWLAQIRVKGATTYLGVYKTPKEAAKAYDKAVDKHHGEFGRKNFPDK